MIDIKDLDEKFWIKTLNETKLYLERTTMNRESADEPFNGLDAGPFRTVMDKMDGVFKKEVINYKRQNGFVVKETATRVFDTDNRDYHDTTTVETLVKID